MTEINPGVRRLVALLNEWAFTTTDSGDGVTNIAAGMEGALDFPHVYIRGTSKYLVLEARDLKELMERHGIAIEPIGPDRRTPAIQATFDPADDSAVILLTGVDDSMLPADPDLCKT